MYSSNDDKVPAKLICYTRSSPSIHQLPAVFPSHSTEELQQSKHIIENLISEKVTINHLITYTLWYACTTG